ncbi:MAG TPA: GAF domain-containing sensor histidine kinase [Thermomicrobiales bacterium]|nr:GAF domain-containing sensor histidine kinase [Thermomicrobiales bacterium]
MSDARAATPTLPPAPEEQEALRRRNRELQILNAISQALNRSLDLQGALDETLRLVTELLDLPAGWIWLLDERSGRPYLAAYNDAPELIKGGRARLRGTCTCVDALCAGELTAATNIAEIECSRLAGARVGTDGIRFHASIPIVAGERPLGVLNVASAGLREFTAEELRFLHTIGYQLGIAVERTRLFEQAGALATAEERNRLAREIHDTLAQGLAAIVLHLETADLLLDGEPPRARERLRRALTLARENLVEARRSVQGLRATALEGRSLGEGLLALAERFTDEYDVPVACTVDALPPLSPRVEADLYRIAQEALTNCGKYAQAGRVTLTLERDSRALTLTIADDGAGFDPASPPAGKPGLSGGFGLRGVGERVAALGGALTLDSAPGHGARLTVTIPLAPPLGRKSEMSSEQ